MSAPAHHGEGLRPLYRLWLSMPAPNPGYLLQPYRHPAIGTGPHAHAQTAGDQREEPRFTNQSSSIEWPRKTGTDPGQRARSGGSTRGAQLPAPSPVCRPAQVCRPARGALSRRALARRPPRGGCRGVAALAGPEGSLNPHLPRRIFSWSGGPACRGIPVPTPRGGTGTWSAGEGVHGGREWVEEACGVFPPGRRAEWFAWGVLSGVANSVSCVSEYQSGLKKSRH